MPRAKAKETTKSVEETPVQLTNAEAKETTKSVEETPVQLTNAEANTTVVANNDEVTSQTTLTRSRAKNSTALRRERKWKQYEDEGAVRPPDPVVGINVVDQ